ncbi:MAG: DUF1186 domain-containing protein [Muribaculaceae bacterium]|nr:DUF1186 domain-containing protein [Muribaculaceae bacterium]
MAKKKHKSTRPQPISPARFMREKARTLPIGKCYITDDWQENGIGHLIITRQRPSGNVVYASFLVDTFCLGIKDAAYHHNMTDYDLEEHLDPLRSHFGLSEISYNEAHNIAYGAIEFAREGGVEPAPDFNIAGYILEEDTEDVPLIEYEFGRNGKHCLFVNENRSEMRFVPQLKKALGDNLEIIYSDSDDYFDDEEYDDEAQEDDSLDELLRNMSPEDIKNAIENMREMQQETDRHPVEEYSYVHPEYPQTLNIRHQFIADEFMKPENHNSLPEEVLDRILALPADEVVEDISNIIYFIIGQTYRIADEDEEAYCEHNALIHCVFILTELKNGKGLDAILEILRQDEPFCDYHLGDLLTECMHYAVHACGQNRLGDLETYLNEPGLFTFSRAQVAEGLAHIGISRPERRGEVIEIFRRLLASMVERLPKRIACDGIYAGMMMSEFVKMRAKELIPEIEAVFATDCVDLSASGNCESVVKDILNDDNIYAKDNFELPTIRQSYDFLQSFGAY